MTATIFLIVCGIVFAYSVWSISGVGTYNHRGADRWLGNKDKDAFKGRGKDER